VGYRVSQATELPMEATTRHHHGNNGGSIIMQPFTIAINSDTGF